MRHFAPCGYGDSTSKHSQNSKQRRNNYIFRTKCAESCVVFIFYFERDYKVREKHSLYEPLEYLQDIKKEWIQKH